MPIWTVPATITRVVDADTFDAILDLGWHISYHAKIRLAGVNAPEMNTPEGRAARNWALDVLGLTGPTITAPVQVISRSLDKYGRVLADVHFDLDPVGQGRRHYNGELLAAGHAVVMKG